MYTIPEWVIIVFAVGSSMSVAHYFGGWPRVAARTWVILFYFYIWLGPDPHNTTLLAAISRVGLSLIFISDIIPALIAKIQRCKRVENT